MDVASNYIFNFEIYAGEQLEGNIRISTLPTDVIIRMIDPVRNSGRTIKMDIYFVSLLWFRVIEEHGLQAVGTVSKNRMLRQEFRKSFLVPDFTTAMSLA